VLEKVKSTIEKAAGSVERLENWGKKKLAYEVKREKKGVYVQLHFRGDGAAVTELERFFRLDDAVMKFLTVKLEVQPERPPSIEPDLEPEHGRV
jgi:small subunit ribosomal protein S6